MIHLEKESERRLTKKLEESGAMVIKFTDPKRNGGPDRLIIGDEFDWFYFVELKTPTGVVSPLQINYAKELAQRLVDVYLLDSPEKVDKFLEERMSLRPEVKDLLLLSSVS